MKVLNAIALLAATVVLAACGSKTKNDETAKTAPATPAATTTPAPSTADAKSDSKKMINKAKPAKTAADAKETKCMSGSEERSLANNAKDGGCELMYTKNGEPKSIASQIIGEEKCVEVMANVRANLEGAGYTCQ